ncbi:MAG: YceI family protein [Planctomycetota bacterium]|jgi:polyisoprenoid-binding protein YceI
MKKIHLATLGLCVFAVTAACEKNPGDGVTAATVGEAGAASGPTAQGTQIKFNESNGAVGFVGSKVTASHEGGFNKYSGNLNLVDNDPAKSSLEVTIDMTSLYADSEKLAGHLKNKDFFEVETYPTSVFRSTQIEKSGDEESGDSYNVTGELTMHGVTKSIKFPASIDVQEAEVMVDSEFKINRRDFNINYGSTGATSTSTTPAWRTT